MSISLWSPSLSSSITLLRSYWVQYWYPPSRAGWTADKSLVFYCIDTYSSLPVRSVEWSWPTYSPSEVDSCVVLPTLLPSVYTHSLPPHGECPLNCDRRDYFLPSSYVSLWWKDTYKNTSALSQPRDSRQVVLGLTVVMVTMTKPVWLFDGLLLYEQRSLYFCIPREDGVNFLWDKKYYWSSFRKWILWRHLLPWADRDWLFILSNYFSGDVTFRRLFSDNQ